MVLRYHVSNINPSLPCISKLISVQLEQSDFSQFFLLPEKCLQIFQRHLLIFYYKLVINQKFEKDIWTLFSLFSLHIRTVNDVIPWYALTFQHLSHFIVYNVFFFHFSNFFATLFVKSTASVILLRGVIYRFASRVWLFQPYLVISVTGSVQLGKNLSHILSLLVS